MLVEISNFFIFIYLLVSIAIAILLIARFGTIRKNFRTDEGVWDLFRSVMYIINFAPFLIGVIITVSGTLALQGVVKFPGEDQFSSSVSVIALGLAIMIASRDEIYGLFANRESDRIKEDLNDIKIALGIQPRNK